MTRVRSVRPIRFSMSAASAALPVERAMRMWKSASASRNASTSVPVGRNAESARARASASDSRPCVVDGEGGQRRALGLEDPADAEQLRGVARSGQLGQEAERAQQAAGVQLGHVGAVALPGLQDAEVDERPYPLTQRSARHAKLGGELLLDRQPGAWAEHAIEDEPLDLMDHHIGLRRRCRRASFARRPGSHPTIVGTDMKVIDAHLHVWDLERADYPWLGPHLAPIDVSFGIDDVRAELRSRRVDGVVLVQAADNAERHREHVRRRRPGAGGRWRRRLGAAGQP